MKLQSRLSLTLLVLFIAIAISTVFIKILNSYSNYISDSIGEIQNKNTESYGLKDFDILKDAKNSWDLNVKAEGSTTNLQFIVPPESKSKYETPASFYLITNNNAAENASK